MRESFLEKLSTPKPIPGGGSAAAYGALVGLALLEKVVRLEFNRFQIPPERGSLWPDLLNRVCHSRSILNRLRDEDGRAYLKWAVAKASSEGEEVLSAALREATECPMNIMKEIRNALVCTLRASEHCKKHLLADLMVVCELLDAGLRGAYYIARTNLRPTEHASWKNDYRNELEQLRDQCRETFLRTEESILARAQLTEQKTDPVDLDKVSP